MMDKYAVDKKDPVEVEAKKLVKKGSVATIELARKKVVEKKK